MVMKLPLTEGDFYPERDCCLFCGASFVNSKEIVTLCLGVSSCGDESRRTGGLSLHFAWHGPELPGRQDEGYRNLELFAPNRETSAELAFCSTRCLRGFFDEIARELE